jgi:hypothetical protein
MPPSKAPGSHIVLIEPFLKSEIDKAGKQIAGLMDLLLGSKRYLEGRNLEDYSGGVIIYTPKARRGYLEPAAIAQVVYIHVRVDPAYATIIGLWLPERQRGWGIPPAPSK